MVTHDGTVLTGQVSVATIFDLLLYKSGGDQVTVLPVHRIKQVHYFDERASMHRRYVRYTSDRGVAQLYEVVVYGAVSVLRRHKPLAGPHADEVHGFHYYTAVGDQVYAMHRFRRQLYDRLDTTTGGKLMAYADQHHLSPHLMYDIFRLVDYYNQLVTDTSVVVAGN